MGVGGQRHAPAALPLGMTRYPLYKRLGRPQCRSGRVLKISTPPGFDHRTVQNVASRYTDYAIPTRFMWERNWILSIVMWSVWGVWVTPSYYDNLSLAASRSETVAWRPWYVSTHLALHTLLALRPQTMNYTVIPCRVYGDGPALWSPQAVGYLLLLAPLLAVGHSCHVRSYPLYTAL
jgi:hypothetical protein